MWPEKKLRLRLTKGDKAPLQTPRGDTVPPQPPICREGVEGGQSPPCKFTIAVDTDGNMVDLPNTKTHNNLIQKNPVLLEQIRTIVKNIHFPTSTAGTCHLPPELLPYQKAIDELLERFGDLHYLIGTGLQHDLSSVKKVTSFHSLEDDDVVYVENFVIPEEFRQMVDRPPSFLEIIYSSLYYLLTEVIGRKYQFFEKTCAQKAYDDCCQLVKYRKTTLISYLVLKYRLDHPILQLNQMREKYVNLLNEQHLPYIHHFDEGFLVKLRHTGNLSPIELQSFCLFYERWAQLFSSYEENKTHRATCRPTLPPPTNEVTETLFKQPPEFRYLDLTHIPPEQLSFPDYDYEILSQNLISCLVHIIPCNLKIPRGGGGTQSPLTPPGGTASSLTPPGGTASSLTPLTPPGGVKPTCETSFPLPYYKRIYLDGCSEPPVIETIYQSLKEVY